MKAKRIRKTRKNEMGQSLVEFALVVPLLLLLLIGIAEFGQAWMTRNIMTGAAREAVRMYAVKDDTAAARARADQILSSAGLDSARATITDNVFGESVSYTINYRFPVALVGFIPGLGNTEILLTSTTTMRKEF
jgi:Flp pilus assembly protein TadG